MDDGDNLQSAPAPFQSASRSIAAMLHPETLDAYRRMSLAERLQLTLELIEENTPYLLMGTPEQVDRKFELLRRENDERNRRMLEGLARLRQTT